MITLTANAAAKVKGILEQERESLPQGGLRIYVQERIQVMRNLSTPDEPT